MAADNSFRKSIIDLAKRMRSDFKAYCASVDLIGVRKMWTSNDQEVLARLNDMQQGFGDALDFFPGGKDFRVCFLGDSLFIVKELNPEDQPYQSWPIFCGHIYALASIIQNMEISIGNPGIRVIMSYGHLSQLYEPDSWKKPPVSEYSNNWFVLTGASEALMKCDQAERLGRKGGFEGGYCWHEVPGNERSYWGTPFCRLLPKHYRQPGLYPLFYHKMCSRHDKTAELSNLIDEQ